MNLSLALIRTVFFILSISLAVTYMASREMNNPFLGIGIGSLLGFFLLSIDYLLRKVNLRSFNIAVVGIGLGYLLTHALLLVFDGALAMSTLKHHYPQVAAISKTILLLLGTYLGAVLTLKASDEFCISIPFIKLTPTAQQKKDFLLDGSALADVRLIDLATTGLFNHSLVIPRFLLKELYTQVEIGDESGKTKARKSLEVIKKLETMPQLHLRFSETDFPDVKDSQGKLIRLARFLDSNILSADISRIQISTLEGIQVINLHALSNALKPITQTGEFIKIRVQRYGKEPCQGVGYLDDGTMVVVNSGGKYLGALIDAQVLSVKHTSSGRMVFCNACSQESTEDAEK